MKNKGMNQENKEKKKRKIKENVYYRATKFRHITYIQGLLKSKVQASLSEQIRNGTQADDVARYLLLCSYHQRAHNALECLERKR